jgi:hypothetical protein
MTTLKLDKYDMAMHKATATDRQEHVLNNLNLMDGNLMATDGFMLVTRKAHIVPEEGEQIDALIPASLIKTIQTKSKNAELKIGGGRVTTSLCNDAGVNVEISAKTGGNITQYPRVADMWPTERPTTKIAFDIALFKKLLSALPNQGALCLGLHEKHQVVEFVCTNNPGENRDFNGMIMPMYMEWDRMEWPSEKEQKNKNAKCPHISIRSYST